MAFNRLLLLGTFVLGGAAFGHDDHAFLAARRPPYSGPGYRAATGGKSPVVFPASGIQLLGWVPLPDLHPGATSGDDCWGYVSPSGREYALIGISNGTAFVDVTQPDDPQLLNVLTGPTSIWRDIKVYSTYAYAVSEGGDGIQVFDLTAIDSGSVAQIASITAAGTLTTAQTHNVAINEESGYLYRLGGGGGTIGLRIYDLNNPASPTFVGEWHDRYIHDAQIVNYTTGPFAGQEIAFCFSETTSSGGNPGVDILNVTNKANITSIAFTPYSNRSFSHQGWLSSDRNYLYVNDELDERDGLSPTTTTRIIDVSDLTAPAEVGSFTSGVAAIDHNLYTLGNRIFEANYRSGLRVFDATNPLAPVQTAFFDTWPTDDAADFNGLWNVYPYLPSGIVLGSDIEKGLFVWWVGEPLISFTYPGGVPQLVDPAGQDFTVDVLEESPGDLVPGSATLHYDTGSGFVDVPLTSESGTLHSAVIPALPCGTVIQYYVSAESTNGIRWRNPQGAPAVTFEATVALGNTLVQLDDVESDAGWTVGAGDDTATTGIWTRVDPLGTTAQPEDDHSPLGTDCWVTGQGTGRGAGENDVDGGKTTLFSPIYDLTGMEMPRIEYWRWYSNAAGGSPNEDVFIVDLSDDGGNSWTNVEVVGPGGDETLGGWIRKEVAVSDLLDPTATMQLRFIAADEGGGSLIEAAVDDVSIRDLACGCPETSHADIVPAGGDGVVDLNDILCVIDRFTGAPGCGGADLFPCSGDAVVDLDDVLSVLAAYAGNSQCDDVCLGE